MTKEDQAKRERSNATDAQEQNEKKQKLSSGLPDTSTIAAVAQVNPKELFCCRCRSMQRGEHFNEGVREGDMERIRICLSCTEGRKSTKEKLCTCCARFLLKNSFSGKQWKMNRNSKSRKCKECLQNKTIKVYNEKQKVASVVQVPPKELQRHQCENILCRESSGNCARNGDLQKIRICLSCEAGLQKERQQSKEEKKKLHQQRREIPMEEVSKWLSERILAGPQERKSAKIDWTSSSITLKDETTMKSKVVVRGQYGRLTKEEINDLSNYIQTSSCAMTLDQVLNLRSQLLQNKAACRHHLLVQNIQKLVSLYKGGDSILSLSQRFDAPPLNVLRVVLQGMKYKKSQIQRGLRDPENNFEPRELKEYEQAKATDYVAIVNWGPIHAAAEGFEDCIAQYLLDEGIQFVRQSQLEKEQLEMFGRQVLTPDFLIFDDLEINGKKVRWIDAKSYYGAITAGFHVKKTCKQMKRYIQHWGPGAIVFLKGFNEKFSTLLKDCSMLNATDFMEEEYLAIADHGM
jgi:hypothetical protein